LTPLVVKFDRGPGSHGASTFGHLPTVLRGGWEQNSHVIINVDVESAGSGKEVPALAVLMIGPPCGAEGLNGIVHFS
jgi:hypothetical protein